MSSKPTNYYTTNESPSNSETNNKIITDPWFWISLILALITIILIILLVLRDKEIVKFPVLNFNDLSE